MFLLAGTVIRDALGVEAAQAVFLVVTVVLTAIYPPHIGAVGSLVPGIVGSVIVVGWLILILSKRLLLSNRTGHYPAELVLELRSLAREGKGIGEMFEAYFTRFPAARGNHNAPLTLFMQAFDLTLHDVILMNGAKHVGNAAYSAEELDEIILPLIREARSRWDAGESMG